MIQVREPRPTRVTAIGWCWIVAGSVKATSLAWYLGALSGRLGDGRDVGLALRAGPSWFAGAATFIFGHLRGLGAFWATLGAFMVFAGASILRRRGWARLGLELVCWFGLVEAPVAGAFLYGAGSILSAHEFPGADRLAAQLFEGVWICAGWLVVYAVFLGLMRRSQPWSS